jgi:hypothetical protein
LRAHLQFLNFTDLTFRVEHGNAGSRSIRETCESGLAGVTRSSGEYHHALVPGAVRLDGFGHEARQYLQRHVLEGAGRAVEQFEHVIIAERLQWSDCGIGPLASICLGHAVAQFLIGEVRQKFPQYLNRDVLIGLVRQIAQVYGFLAERIRDEETSVGGDAFANGLLRG